MPNYSRKNRFSSKLHFTSERKWEYSGILIISVLYLIFTCIEFYSNGIDLQVSLFSFTAKKNSKNKSFELYDCFVFCKVCRSKILLVIILVLHQFFLLETNIEFFRNVCDLQLLSFLYHFHWNMSLVSSNSKVEKSPWRYKRLGYFKYY